MAALGPRHRWPPRHWGPAALRAPRHRWSPGSLDGDGTASGSSEFRYDTDRARADDLGSLAVGREADLHELGPPVAGGPPHTGRLGSAGAGHRRVVLRHMLPWPLAPEVQSMQRGAVEVTVQAPFGPLRVTTTLTSRSGRAATAISRCSHFAISAVPNWVMMSPG